MTELELVKRLRKQSVCIYIAVEEPVADDISAAQREAADTIEALHGALVHARPAVARWCHTQGDNAEFHRIVLGPIDAAIALAEKEKTMTSVHIEAMKRAMWATEYSSDVYDWDTEFEGTKKQYEWFARAALLALAASVRKGIPYEISDIISRGTLDASSTEEAFAAALEAIAAEGQP